MKRFERIILRLSVGALLAAPWLAALADLTKV